MTHRDKPIVWMASEIKTPPFTVKARLEAGILLRRLQKGQRLSMPHSRPMASGGRGCHELRIVDEGGTRRIMYFIDADAIVILNVSSKKTRRTPQKVISTCRRRLMDYKEVRA